jgi:hypothetical protein
MAFRDVLTGLDSNGVLRIHQLMDQLMSIFRFLIKLTPDERMALPAVGDRRWAFLTKNFRHAQRHADLLPPFRDILNYKRVYYDYTELLQVLDRVNELQEALTDTVMQIGANGFDFALVFYDMAEKAAASGQPGTETMYKSLAKHFARINKSTDEVDIVVPKIGSNDTPNVNANVQDPNGQDH